MFDEEDSWEWDISSNEKTVSFPLVDGEPNHVTREDLTPPTSPNSSRRPQSSADSSSKRPRHTRNLRELYNETEVLDNPPLFCLFADSEPLNIKEGEDKNWRLAMDEEIQAIKKNDTWGVNWIYKMKKNVKGGVERYKARLVAKGYSQ